MKGMLSVIIPAMNEEGNIPALVSAVRSAVEPLEVPYELIIIDDGSRDGTWNALKEASKDCPELKGIRFARNFGKEAAMSAGLKAATGECAVIMDADLQHPPETIGEMYSMWREGGYAVVEAKKRSRGKEGLVYKTFTKIFYGMLRRMSGLDLANASDFKLIDRRVIDVLNASNEYRPFFRGTVEWMGYPTGRVEFDVRERNAGRSAFTPVKLVKYALSSVSAFTAVPLQFATFFGGASLFASAVLWIIALVRAFVAPYVGAALILSAVMLLCTGLILISLGIVGYYLSRVFDEQKGRPRYLIGEKFDGGNGNA
ncbi:MAG: glycosyltransferase family 2 protein [Clostridia bacterium]|nr:glycosyltransferase family 2 protein [Clostridia bacterium]